MLNLIGLHHARFHVRDLDVAERFANDFGLKRAARDERTLFMHGAGPGGYYYVAESAATSGLAYIAYEVVARSDLEYAVARLGATAIRALDGPCGGEAVSLIDPEGLRVELVHGIAPRDPEVLPAPLIQNDGGLKTRIGLKQNTGRLGPPQLLRLGHYALYVQDFMRMSRWYQEVLGFLPSDITYAESPAQQIGGFLRVNRGTIHTDHHVVFMVQWDKTDIHHMSFEVQDYERQFLAHRWLKTRGWESVWGVGRHPLGAHIFDVWMSPDGVRFETFSDTDLFDASYQPGMHALGTQEVDAWSADPPDRYFGEIPEMIKARRGQHSR